MKNIFVAIFLFAFAGTSNVFSQTVVADSKEKELIGKWVWVSVTTTNKDNGVLSVQNEYVPGVEASHHRIFKSDKSVEMIDIVPMTDNNINTGHWNTVKDTLFIKWDKRVVTATFSVEKDKLFLTYIKVTDTDFENDYRKSKYKATEEYKKE